MPKPAITFTVELYSSGVAVVKADNGFEAQVKAELNDPLVQVLSEDLVPKDSVTLAGVFSGSLAQYADKLHRLIKAVKS